MSESGLDSHSKYKYTKITTVLLITLAPIWFPSIIVAGAIYFILGSIKIGVMSSVVTGIVCSALLTKSM